MSQPRLYRDHSVWKELQQVLPAPLRLEADMPREEFWPWHGHDIHLDRYPNPDAPAKILLHHGVGTNGRQMNLILGAPLARRGWETVAVDNLGYGMTTQVAGDHAGLFRLGRDGHRLPRHRAEPR